MPNSPFQTMAPAPPAVVAPLALTAIAVVVAMLLGGSGSLVPFPEIVLQCLLAALIVAWVWLRPDGLRGIPRGAWIITVLLLAVPLGQLVPLPPAIWQHLPGRSMEQAALALVGQDSSWQPLSLTGNRTLAGLLVMAAAAAVLVMVAAQDRRGRTILLATVAAVALLSVVVGAAQLSGGPGSFFRFYNPDEAFLDGFQTNHNAEADVLLIGMVALAAAVSDWADQRRRPIHSGLLLGVVGAASLLLILGVVLTASRTGIALLPIALAGQGLILRRWLQLDKRRMIIALIAAMAALGAALGAGAALMGRHGALGTVWARFHTAAEFRPEIWRDSLFALHQYWPWGAGMGSFIPVFAAAERLEVVTGRFVNRAHDDYLEFLIEAGLPGILAFGLICRQIGRDAWAGWRARATDSGAQWVCGAAALGILALHSLGDYPLRTMSIACMAALSAGLLLPVVNGAKSGIVK